MKKKRGNKILIVLVIILLITIPLTYFIFIDKSQNILKNTFENIFIPEPTSSQGNPSTTTNDNNQPASEGGSNNGGGSGGGSVNSQNAVGNNCQQQQISYSISNINKIQTCNFLDADSTTCIDKSVECSVEVKNLDSQISGTFEIQFLYVLDGQGTDNFFDSTSSESEISPGQTKTFSGLIQISDPAKTNEEINCFFQTLSVPTKEIC